MKPPRTDRDVALELGAKIRALRLELGWSQERLAHATYVSYSTVAQIERGDRAARATTVLLLAAALDVTPGYLLDDVRPPDRTS